MKKLLLAVTCFTAFTAYSQKKPLDHTVYDGWQSVAERIISNDGKYVAYTVNPQEGDGELVIQAANGGYKLTIPRGYNVSLSEDSRFAICRIKPFYKDTRNARIKKSRPDDMPKDSLAIVELGKTNIVKIARVRSYKTPDKGGSNWMAYLMDKAVPEQGRPGGRPEMDSLTRLNNMLAMADSLAHVADSIRNKANDARNKGMAVLQQGRGAGGGRPQGGGAPAAGGRGGAAPSAAAEPGGEEGTELILRNLVTGEQRSFKLVSEYYFSKNGNVLLYETTKKTGDSTVLPSVVRMDLTNNTSATIFRKFNDAKGYTMDENASQIAFIAERDSSSKAVQKFYKLFYYKEGTPEAVLLADASTKGVKSKWTIAETGGGGGGFRGGGDGGGSMGFSKSGQRLFFATTPIVTPKDTSLPEFDRVNVDVWHYNDDYVQPVQLKNLESDLRRSYIARFDMNNKEVVQLGTPKFRSVMQTKEGDGNVFYATTDSGRRVASQWQGFTVSDIYAINPENGKADLIRKEFKGSGLSASYSGNFLVFFDEIKKSYFCYNAATKQVYPIATDIKVSLVDEENDVPDDPNSYGIVRWMENDKYVLIYDRYDIWQVDPLGKEKSVALTNGRKDKLQYRYVNVDREERFIEAGKKILLKIYDEKDKGGGLAIYDPATKNIQVLFKEKVAVGAIQKAKDADVYTFTKETYVKSPDVYVMQNAAPAVQLSHINPQQETYNWGTAELFKWKAYTGKETEGVLYKPEDFDPKKKYPMIVYFYERNNNTLNNYQAPAPTPSRLNIPFFVSRGYIVFVPDIWYKTGYPGQGAYDYIVSGTRAVVKQGYVDSTKIGLQGQSWGGYQIVYLITKTNLYAAAWAGAPVANMTSAYGGIRWGTGLLRTFQYEKTQSRIGATLWEKPNLYIQNSALFSLPKVTTPLVIMANDADDAVPWYQGIEMYSGLRRLGKKVWMLNYNNEAHNLVERKNRKDIQIREQQFFDYLLKGDKPAKWISEGVPAVMKGRDLGLGY
ncbi:alpha/beta hydrolase family protein [Sediminibacterium ginsengisoli]|uniref:Dipeptidyl aminopeptidase/acylaminoacyl peptidase n=1 Tax=Sediminibacterium ginsengisoli TaxID=413434 RepID=A0A1T4PKX9_9BACT|nr:prolyl oligopeptidase family serine peptidase [Sediminibacterium ginsengisoli]SJZ92254.1 Dipeptidyl aminopeptidase/acylaminoacyl peptidase [Sediminibacterium ginsengisoli]